MNGTKVIPHHLRTLGERLRYRRRQMGWTQEQLAVQAGTNQAVIQKIENGTGHRTVAQHLTQQRQGTVHRRGNGARCRRAPSSGCDWGRRPGPGRRSERPGAPGPHATGQAGPGLPVHSASWRWSRWEESLVYYHGENYLLTLLPKNIDSICSAIIVVQRSCERHRRVLQQGKFKEEGGCE